MTTRSDVVKTSKAIKSMTTPIRSHFDVVERAREIYLAHIKKAEMDYFERIRRATGIITGEDTSAPVQEELPGTNGPDTPAA